MVEQNLIEKLNTVLADTYVTLMLTQNVHWNIVGTGFHGIHKMTEAQYEEMFTAVDGIAERIRALGYPAPSGLDEYAKLTTIKTTDTTMLNTISACQHLIDANQQLSQSLRAAVDLAEADNDHATADLMISRVQQHDKYIWMLTATVTGAD